MKSMRCFLCSHPTDEWLDLGKQPLANKYPRESEFENEAFFPLTVFFCPACKNVQLGQVVSREQLFVDYFYLSSVNPGLVRHFEGLAQKLSGARLVVDIGSNDGILLKPLKALGVTAVGVEPSVNVSKIANDQGLVTLTSFFNAEAVDTIINTWGLADVIVASSIFTHLEDPHAFLKDAKTLLTDDGQLIIEVEYIGNIIKNTQFERFYFDRVFYYSLSSLKALCEINNLMITDVEMIEPHGGSMRVVVKRQHGLNVSTASLSPKIVEEENRLLTPEGLAKFRVLIDEHTAALRQKLVEYQQSGLRVAGYGAPARVATICNYAQIGPDLISFIVDDSPLKQHRFSPGTHIPIVPKTYLDKHGVDVLVVFAYEYFQDIKKKTAGQHRYLFPIPPREVV